MTQAQARDILAAYRPGLADDEPLFVEALALAQKDAELRAWFDEQQRLDAAIRRKLRPAATPPDLLEQVHAGVAARRERNWRRVLPLAACLVGLGLLALFWMNRNQPTSDSFARCRSDLARLLQTFPRLDVEAEQFAAMRRWLAEKHALAQVELPGGLKGFPGIGCRTVAWRGKELALLCFMVDGEVVHLFVMRAGEFPEGSFASVPHFAKAGRFSTATWQTDGLAFLALTPGDEAFLRSHL